MLGVGPRRESGERARVAQFDAVFVVVELCEKEREIGARDSSVPGPSSLTAVMNVAYLPLRRNGKQRM